jgi:hypothetical protein
MIRGHNRVGVAGPRNGTSSPGTVMVATLLAVVVLMVLSASLLTLSMGEEFNAQRERNALLAFYAVEAGAHEALVRMNLDPVGAADDETEVKWNGNPDSVRDPRIVQGNPPDPNPANYSDSTVNNWRFWNYDPSWRYAGTSDGGEGNYPAATPAQQGNLGTAGRGFSYNSASGRTLVSGSTYSVRVVPHVRNIAGTWTFVSERGSQAKPNHLYYRIDSIGTYRTQTATADVIAQKFFFGISVPGALTAGGNVMIGGNASVSMGDVGDANPTGVAAQSAGTTTVSGSGMIPPPGVALQNTLFPGFETIFGLTPAELQPQAQPPSGITATYTASNTTNPTEVPSGTVGKMIWLTAKASGVKKDITFTGTGAGGYTIGSPSQPVLLVVDGNLNLNSVTIYGVVYITGAFRNQGGSLIKGAILVEGTAETDVYGTGSTGTKIDYSLNVLRELNRDQKMFPFRFVKGSWRLGRG